MSLRRSCHLPFVLTAQVSDEREVNVLKPHLRATVETLLARGQSQREIERLTGVNRRTIRAIAAKCSGVATGSNDPDAQNAPPRPPTAQSASLCEPHRDFIEKQLALSRNATAIFQDLVDDYGFAADGYNSVKRFVRKLRAHEPERFDVLDFPPGEEAQVDYGQGAPTRQPNGKYRRPYLFVMVLKYSGKAFRKTVWKTSQEIWARLHEEAFRSFGGAAKYAVLDNLEGGRDQAGPVRAGTQPGLRPDARPLPRRRGSVPGRGSRSQGKR